MATILIVEDELFVRQLAEWTMQDLGHEILVACDLNEALAHLSAARAVDALFVDIRLKTSALAGFDIANQGVLFWPELRVLYTSGSTLTDEMSNRFVGGGRFIAKPYSAEQLERSVGQLLN